VRDSLSLHRIGSVIQAEIAQIVGGRCKLPGRCSVQVNTLIDLRELIFILLQVRLLGHAQDLACLLVDHLVVISLGMYPENEAAGPPSTWALLLYVRKGTMMMGWLVIAGEIPRALFLIQQVRLSLP